MSSFQQVVMGGICLVAAFWFGSYINEHPASVQQPLQTLPDGTVVAGNSGQPFHSKLAAKSKGFLDSLFGTPAKPQPVTLSDLKARSVSTNQNVATHDFSFPNKMVEAATEVVSDYSTPPLPNVRNDLNFVPNNQNDPQRLEIVPNFSTLVEDVRRVQAEQSPPIGQFASTPASAKPIASMLPVPKLNDFSNGSSLGQGAFQQPKRDWNVVKQGVMSVEDKLKQFRSAHPEPEVFKPVPAFDPTFQATSNNASGRFVSETAAASQKIERQQFVQPELREQRLRPAPVAADTGGVTGRFIPNSSLDSTVNRAEGSISRNPLRTDNNQWTDPRPSRSAVEPNVNQAQFNRGQLSRSQFERSGDRASRQQDYRPAPSESLAQRKERWNVFKDRTGREANPVAAAKPVDNYGAMDDYGAKDRNRAMDNYGAMDDYGGTEMARATNVPTIPKGSRVRSLNEIQFQSQERFTERVARQQPVAARRPTPQPVRQQPLERVQEERLTGNVEPEVVRYEDFKSYVTQEGDTLQTISQSFFGEPEYYFDLYLANRAVLANPATVPVGIKLRIPRLDQ